MMKLGTTFKAGLILVSMLFAGQTVAAGNDANVPDAQITTTVKNKLSQNPSLSSYSIDVDTNDGVVILTGTVGSDDDAMFIIQEAQSTPGVKDVNTSKLSVKKSNQPFSDTVITAKVKGKFIAQKLFDNKNIDAMSIHVKTTNGVVQLTGKADSQQQANNAISIAKSVEGVKDVESRIQLK